MPTITKVLCNILSLIVLSFAYLWWTDLFYGAGVMVWCPVEYKMSLGGVFWSVVLHLAYMCLFLYYVTLMFTEIVIYWCKLTYQYVCVCMYMYVGMYVGMFIHLETVHCSFMASPKQKYSFDKKHYWYSKQLEKVCIDCW